MVKSRSCSSHNTFVIDKQPQKLGAGSSVIIALHRQADCYCRSTMKSKTFVSIHIVFDTTSSVEIGLTFLPVLCFVKGEVVGLILSYL